MVKDCLRYRKFINSFTYTKHISVKPQQWKTLSCILSWYYQSLFILFIKQVKFSILTMLLKPLFSIQNTFYEAPGRNSFDLFPLRIVTFCVDRECVFISWTSELCKVVSSELSSRYAHDKQEGHYSSSVKPPSKWFVLHILTQLAFVTVKFQGRWGDS